MGGTFIGTLKRQVRIAISGASQPPKAPQLRFLNKPVFSSHKLSLNPILYVAFQTRKEIAGQMSRVALRKGHLQALSQETNKSRNFRLGSRSRGPGRFSRPTLSGDAHLGHDPIPDRHGENPGPPHGPIPDPHGENSDPASHTNSAAPRDRRGPERKPPVRARALRAQAGTPGLKARRPDAEPRKRPLAASPGRAPGREQPRAAGMATCDHTRCPGGHRPEKP